MENTHPEPILSGQDPTASPAADPAEAIVPSVSDVDAAPAAAEEAAASVDVPVAAEESTVYDAAPVTAEETVLYDAAPVTADESAVYDAAPVTAEETALYDAAPVTAEETTLYDAAPVTADESIVYDDVSVTAQESTVYDDVPVTAEEAAVCHEAPVTAETPVMEQAAASAEETSPAVSSGVSVKPPKKAYNSYKRSTVRQYSSTLSLFIMVPVFFLLTLFIWLFPRSTKSEIEKRNLDSFPELTAENYFSGKFTSGVNHWFTDTVPYRDTFKDWGNNFKSSFGITTQETVNVVGDVKKAVGPPPIPGGTKPAQTAPASTTPVSESSQPANPSDPGKPQGQETSYEVKNNIVVAQQNGHYRAIELFGGVTDDGYDHYTDTLNDLRESLDSSVRIYSMLAPLSCEFYLPSDCSEPCESQRAAFTSVWAKLYDGITTVDTITALKEHTNESIYFRTAREWTAQGAYYAAQAFAKQAGVDFKELNTYTPQTIKDYVGDLYAATGDQHLKEDAEDFVYYVPEGYDQTMTYYYQSNFNFNYASPNYFKTSADLPAKLVYFGGNDQIVKVTTGVQNGRRLLVVKDSFGDAVPGFLMHSFEEILIIDVNTFKLNLVKFIQTLNVTDVLFTMDPLTAFGSNSAVLPALLTQNPDEAIIDYVDPGVGET